MIGSGFSEVSGSLLSEDEAEAGQRITPEKNLKAISKLRTRSKQESVGSKRSAGELTSDRAQSTLHCLT